MRPDSDMEQRLEAEYMAWFRRLQDLSQEPLTPDVWVTRWYDNWTPEAALAAGPEEAE
jgi:hypothetical protein